MVLQNPVTGEEISQAFHGAVSFNGMQATASGLPHAGTLKAGQPVTKTVTVHNTGVQSIAVGTDPRLDMQQTTVLSAHPGRRDLRAAGGSERSADLPDPAGYLEPDCRG